MLGRQIGFSIVTALALILAALPGVCDELFYDEGVADNFTFQLTDGYLVRFTPPAFEEPFLTEVSFFGYRYGEMDKNGPPQGYLAILDKTYNKLYSRNFSFNEIGTLAGWNKFKIDPLIIREAFWVYFLLPSGSGGGIMMGQDLEPAKLRSRIGNPAAGYKQIEDGKFNWMIRAVVVDSLAPKTQLTSDNLVGPKFLAKDGGTNSGFLTFYRYGATVRFDPGSPVTIRKVYVYGKLAGQWQGTDSVFAIYLLDKDLRIQMVKNFKYSNYTSTAEWKGFEIPETKMSSTFYVVVETKSRDTVQMFVGYDASGNKGSSVTNIGQPVNWPFKEDAKSLNWMVRLESK
ncbi:MAG: hypothetical protein HRF49_06535 [bacterium]|jgi:hypothetical protein